MAMGEPGTGGNPRASVRARESGGQTPKRCGYCRRPIFLMRNGEWYHSHNGSVSCYPGSGSRKKAFPGG